VDNILTNSLLPDISRQILGGMAEGEKMSAIHVGIGNDGEFVYQTPEVADRVQALV
jgi:type VI secretion system protein VasG